MQAYVYVRFSDKRQEKGASRERQLEDCRKLCDRRGWTIVDTIEDLGRSAWTGDHLASGELGKFAERVMNGEIGRGSVLVVERLDRISRQAPRKTQRWLEDICEKGVCIATADGERVYDDAGLNAEIMWIIEILSKAHGAHDESQKKSERVRDRITRNMAEAKATGRVITAKAPGWLKMRPDRSGFDVDPNRAALVREMYEMAAEGIGPRLIAKLLNERGVLAWGKWRKPTSTPTWELTYVKLILRQPAVEGDYQPGFSNTKESRTKFAERLVGYYPRIVDADLVARARRNLDSRKLVNGPEAARPGVGGRHTRNVANLFAGMVTCGRCGNPMHLRTNGERPPTRHWQCNFASRSRGCSQTQMFRYRPFEKAALDSVLHLALDDWFFAAPDQTAKLSTTLAELEKALRDREAEATRLVRLLARVDDAPEIERELADLGKMRRVLEADRDKVADALQAARGAVSPAEHLRRVAEVRGALDDADADIRRLARARVKTALRELGCRVVCAVEDSDRKFTMWLGDGSFFRTFDNTGAETGTFDLIRSLSERHPEKAPEEVAAMAADALRGMANDILTLLGRAGETSGSESVKPDYIRELAMHVRREREKAGA